MFPINVVEKETGISKYLLRMWERRYSFPRPERDLKGERVYSILDVEKLKIVKSLMEEGYRPSKIINQDIQDLKELLKSFTGVSQTHNKLTPGTVILITNPDLEQDVRASLKRYPVKKIIVISSKNDLETLSL
jgi:hypothetical protein